MVNRGLGWAVEPVDAAAQVGRGTETAVELGLAGAQGETGEDGFAENIQDPTQQKYVFVGNIACCPQCAAMSGMEVPAGVSILEISHPNCRCQIVPASVANNMLMNQLPNPVNPNTGVPFTKAQTQAAINRMDYNQAYADRLANRRLGFMGLRR